MDKGKGEDEKEGENFSHIAALIRAIHTPTLNISRPEDRPPSPDLQPPAHLSVSRHHHHLLGSYSSGVLPVIFDIDSSESSSKNNSPTESTVSLKENAVSPKDSPETKDMESSPKTLEETNLERFNKNVINVMDTLIHSRSASSPLSSPPITSTKPFNFYNRLHRHHSAHSLNIPSIVVTGTDADHPHHHLSHLKRFGFGLRRHSHALTVFMRQCVCVVAWRAIRIARNCNPPKTLNNTCCIVV